MVLIIAMPVVSLLFLQKTHRECWEGGRCKAGLSRLPVPAGSTGVGPHGETLAGLERSSRGGQYHSAQPRPSRALCRDTAAWVCWDMSACWASSGFCPSSAAPTSGSGRGLMVAVKGYANPLALPPVSDSLSVFLGWSLGMFQRPVPPLTSDLLLIANITIYDSLKAC